jgi:hypothetical protein
MGKAGYQSFNVFVHCFLMSQDLKEMKSFVGSSPPDDIDKYFKDLIDAWNNIDTAEAKETQRKKIDLFLTIAEAEHDKMFTPWVNGGIAFLAGFSEQQTARIVCCHLLSLPELFIAPADRYFHN